MKRGANAPYLVGALVADGIELGGTGSRPARAAKAPAARRAGRGLWRASLEIFRLRSVPWQRSWVCLFCAFFSSRARFDDESCSDKFGSKLSTVISLFNKSDGAMLPRQSLVR